MSEAFEKIADYYAQNREKILMRNRLYRMQNKAKIQRKAKIYRRKVKNKLIRQKRREKVGRSYVTLGLR